MAVVLWSILSLSFGNVLIVNFTFHFILNKLQCVLIIHILQLKSILGSDAESENRTDYNSVTKTKLTKKFGQINTYLIG